MSANLCPICGKRMMEVNHHCSKSAIKKIERSYRAQEAAADREEDEFERMEYGERLELGFRLGAGDGN